MMNKRLFCWVLLLLALSLRALDIPYIQIPDFEDSQAPELKLQVLLFPDESYLLQGVIPESFRHYAEEYLYEHELQALLGEDNKEPGFKEITIPIRYFHLEEAPLSQAELKAQIDDWIVKQRDNDKATNPYRDWLDPMASEVLAYRTSIGTMGLISSPKNITYQGFDLPLTALEPLQQLAWLKSFDQGQQKNQYPFEPLFTSIHAGMGEYDSRFAKFKLARNYLFGKKGLYYGLDLKVANGYWLGYNNAQTSMRHFLEVPLADDLNLSLEYASFAHDLSSFTLQPAYLSSSAFMLERSGEYVRTELASQYLDLSFLRFREALKSPRFPIKPQSLTYQAQARRMFKLGQSELDLAWVHKWSKEGFVFPTTRDYKDLAKLDWTLSHNGFEAFLNAELSELKDISTELSLTYQSKDYQLSGGWERNWAGFEANVQVSDIYNVEAWLSNPELEQTEDRWLQASSELSKMQLSFRAGQKRYSQSLATAGFSLDTFEPFYLALGAKLCWDLKMAKLNFKQNLLYMQADDSLRNTPHFRGFGELELRRDLAHDNSIFAAISYLFHSNYRPLYEPTEDLGFAMLADARLGVQISKAFEIEAGIKNLGNNYIFGVMPIPWSLHTSLSWYFIN